MFYGYASRRRALRGLILSSAMLLVACPASAQIDSLDEKQFGEMLRTLSRTDDRVILSNDANEWISTACSAINKRIAKRDASLSTVNKGDLESSISKCSLFDRRR